MFKAFTLSVLVIGAASAAFAQQGELPFSNRHGAKAVDKILASLEGKDSWDIFAVANGSHDIFTFDPATFSAEAATQKVTEYHSNSENACQYETEVGPTVWAALKKTEEDSAFEEPQGLKTLKKLEATGQTLFIASRSWDGASGDSEYCNKYYYTIYFKNGKGLSIDYDITD